MDLIEAFLGAIIVATLAVLIGSAVLIYQMFFYKPKD